MWFALVAVAVIFLQKSMQRTERKEPEQFGWLMQQVDKGAVAKLTILPKNIAEAVLRDARTIYVVNMPDDELDQRAVLPADNGGADCRVLGLPHAAEPEHRQPGAFLRPEPGSASPRERAQDDLRRCRRG